MATDVFADPFKSSGAFADPYKKGVFADPFGQSDGNTAAIDTTEELQKLATEAGMEKHQPTVVRAVEKVGRVLNWDVANISGMAIGMLRDNMSVMEGRKYGVARNTGFADVYKEIFGKPTTKTGKAAIGTAGFISDVLFSPLTYLSFGTVGLARAGVKVTKPGMKLFQAAEKQFTSHAETLVKEGMMEVPARKVAMFQAKQDLNTFIQRALSGAKKGTLSKADYEDLIERGLDSGTVEHLMQLGGHIIDQGGIKMFGKTLVSSERLAATPLGTAARKIGELETVRVLGDTLGKIFVTDFKKNPKLLEIANRSSMASKRAFKAITDRYDTIFKDVNDAEGIEISDTLLGLKKDVIDTEKKIIDTEITSYHKQFPEDKLPDASAAPKLLATMEDDVADTMKEIRERTDAILSRNGKTREALLPSEPSGKRLGAPAAPITMIERKTFREGFLEREKRVLAEQSSTVSKPIIEGPLQQLDNMTLQLDELDKYYTNLINENRAIATKKLNSVDKLDEFGGPITDAERVAAKHNYLAYQLEKKWGEIEKAYVKIEKLKEKIKNGELKTLGVEKTKLSVDEVLIYSERAVKKLQNDLATKERMLRRIMDARRIAKAKQRDIILKSENPKIQKVYDELYNGKKSIAKELASLAGIDEVDAFKFYFPSIFEEYTTIKKSAFGRNMSPFGKVKDDFKKMYTGAERKDIIKKPAEAFKRRNIEVANARIKSNGIKAIYKAFEKQTAGRTEAELSDLGFVKYEKKVLGETLTGWIPKEIKEEVINFAEPKKSGIDELARVTGFDWATNMMKSWSTSLFPAFHVLNVSSNQFQLMVKLGVDWMNPKSSYNTTALAFATAFPHDGLIRKTLGLGKDWEKKFLDSTFVDKAGKKWTNREFVNQIKKQSDVLDQGIFGDFEQGLTDIGTKTNWNPASLNFAALHHGREIGNFGEVQAKLMAIQTGIMEGKTMKQSIKDAEDAIFNYSKLTSFEREYMKRLIPFYTFARKNAEFQIKTLATNPGRVASQFKLFNNLNESFGNGMSQNDEAGLPNFVVDKLGIKAGVNKYGQQEVMTGFGLPIEEFLSRFSGENGFVWNTMKNVMAQGNPLLKYPTEKVTGVDLYKGKPIIEIDNGESFKGIIDALGGEQKGVGKEFADLVGFRKVAGQPRFINGIQVGTYDKYIADPTYLHFFRNLPTARLQRTIQKSEQEDAEEYTLRALLGVNTFTIDQEREKFFKDLKEKKELARWLDRAGIINTKEIYFQPKQ